MKSAALLLLAALGLAGCFDPIVGAECADGYVACGGKCLPSCSPGVADAANDLGAPSDTGSSGDRTLSDDGTTGDTGTDRGAGGDSSRGEGGSAEAGGGDSSGGSGDSSSGSGGDSGGGSAADGGAGPDAADASADDAAPPADASPADDVSVADAAVPDDAAVADAGPEPDVAPEPDCGMMQIRCSGVCLDPSSDPDNCGSCGFGCGTGLCVNGQCQLRQAGHLVVIGHDYAVSRSGMDNILGNAVFLALRNPAEVLAYEGTATAEEVRGTDAAINNVAAATGRMWRKTIVNSLTLLTMLPTADVLVIYAQPGSPDAALLALGTLWSQALNDFVQAGKTIVALESTSGNVGTYQILQQANLFHANARFDATGQTVTVVQPGDAVATRAPRTYRGERGTVWFDTPDSTVVFQLLTDGGLMPVVVHLVF